MCESFAQMNGMTSNRRRILDAVQKSSKPVSAAEIIQKTGADTSTVYRALSWLEEQNAVESIALSGVRLYFVSHNGHGHFLVCETCHEMISFDQCTTGKLAGELEKQYGYRIASHVIFFKGTCGVCAAQVDKLRHNRGG